MLLIIYSILIGYMVFFTLCIAPIINNTLDRENASKLLRKVFPKNFLFGLVLSILAILASFLLEQNNSLIIAIFLTCLFLLNLYYVMPKINTVEEMVDLVSASRNYEANISVLTATKNMAKKAMDI